MTGVDLVRKVSAALRSVARYEPMGVSTSALAREISVPRATAHRLLHSLQAEGVVDRIGDSARWVLGPEAHLLGLACAARYDISASAQPILHALSSGTGESAFYSVRRGNETVCLLADEGSFPLRSHVLHPGRRFPLGVASAGLVILAMLDRPASTAYLNGLDLVGEYGEQHSRAEIEKRLVATRRVGYSVNPGLVVPGSWGVAAAVLDHLHRPVGALSLTGVQTRFTRPRIPELGAALLRAAHELSRSTARSATPATP